MNENIILKTENLSKRFGKIEAVKNLSFTISKGSVFGILGPNGGGKSTTLGILLDIIKPDTGNFTWFGDSTPKDYRKRIGSLIEKPNFYDYLSAYDNLKIVAEIRNVEKSEIDKVLKVVNLYERRKSRFSTYSLGMKQRLAIASALLGNPEVLILDEPTNGLDPYGIAEVRNLINDLATMGITIILASHLLDEVQKVCTHVLVMKKGEKLFADTVDVIKKMHTRIEVNAANPEKLKEVILTHPKIIALYEESSVLIFDAEPDIRPDELNSYLAKYDVILSHLAFSRLNFEKQILDLLDGNDAMNSA